MATKNVPGPVKNTAVVNYQEQLAKEAAEGASQEAAQTEFISFKGGILALPTGVVKDNTLNVVILDTAYEHAFYGDYNDGNPEGWAYDPNTPKSPSCYAFGRVESELAPVQEGEGAPDAVVHTECATCPLNEWGSDPEGGKGKACKNVRRLAVIDAGALASGNPEAVRAATVMYVKLPVTSGKLFSAHVVNLANVCKRPPYAVISKLTLERHATRQFEVKWEFVDMIPDALLGAIMEKREKLGDAILYGYPSNIEREQSEAPAQPAKTASKYAAPPKPQKAARK